MLLFLSERVRIPDVFGLDDGYIAVGVENGLLVIRLIRVDSQQIQIRGKDLLRHAAVRPQYPYKRILNAFVFRLHGLIHTAGNGNFLVAGECLAHVGQRQKRRFFQQEP